MNLKALVSGCFAVSLMTLQAAAHHSFAMFEPEKIMVLQGTVKEFEWVNPHSWLHVMAADSTGVVKQWSVEMASTGALTGAGWTRDAIKVGDKVTVEMHPLKDGTRGGTIVSVLLPDGKKLGSAGQRNDPLNVNIPRR